MDSDLPFGLEADQENLALLRNALAAALRDHEDAPEQLWQALSREIGLGGAAIAPEHGGMGGGAAEAWVILEALGRSPGWTPYLASVVLGAGALRLAGGAKADEILPGVASGEILLSLAYLEPDRRNAVEPLVTVARPHGDGYLISGRKTAALALDKADYVVFSAAGPGDGATLFCVDTSHPGLDLTPYVTIDGEGAADLELADLELTADHVVGRPGEGMAVLERLVDEGIAATCAIACGTMRAMIERTVDYCRQRKQFGRALADFQVLKHRLVDMHVATEQAASLTQLAFAKLDAPAPERREAVSGAKYLVAEACRSVSHGAVQLHGGIGTTEELVIGRFFKRALMLEHLFGGAAYHLDRYRKARACASMDALQQDLPPREREQ